MAIRCARGTQDVLAADVPSWRFLESVAIELAECYGYREIRTPIFETYDLFLHGLGANSGVVERELWTFQDKHGRKLALRADMTAPTVRAYNEHQLGKDHDGPVKLFYMGPVFMYGRGHDVESRQVHQLGFEVLGGSDPALDTESIMMAVDLCSALGLPDVQVQLNSLGCKRCRAQYQQVMREYFAGHTDELCSSCKRRYRNQPLWTLGCEKPECQALAIVAPSIYGYLCNDCRSHFDAVKSYLEELKINYRLNPLVVRDLEYYNRTTFQVTCAGKAVAFGGRYDELGQMLGGASLPAVGCSIDAEPLFEVMAENGICANAPSAATVCLAGEGREAVALIMPALYALRRAGVKAELAPASGAPETALASAHKSGSRYVVTLGAADVRERVVEVFESENGSSRHMRLEEALARLGSNLGVGHLADELRPVEVRQLSISHRQPMRSRGRTLYGSEAARVPKSVRGRFSEVAQAEDRQRRHRRRRVGLDSETVVGRVGRSSGNLGERGSSSLSERSSSRLSRSERAEHEESRTEREVAASERNEEVVEASAATTRSQGRERDGRNRRGRENQKAAVEVTAAKTPSRRRSRRRREAEDSLEVCALEAGLALDSAACHDEPAIALPNLNSQSPVDVAEQHVSPSTDVAMSDNDEAESARVAQNDNAEVSEGVDYAEKRGRASSRQASRRVAPAEEASAVAESYPETSSAKYAEKAEELEAAIDRRSSRSERRGSRGGRRSAREEEARNERRSSRSRLARAHGDVAAAGQHNDSPVELDPSADTYASDESAAGAHLGGASVAVEAPSATADHVADGYAIADYTADGYATADYIADDDTTAEPVAAERPATDDEVEYSAAPEDGASWVEHDALDSESVAEPELAYASEVNVEVVDDFADADVEADSVYADSDAAESEHPLRDDVVAEKVEAGQVRASGSRYPRRSYSDGASRYGESENTHAPSSRYVSERGSRYVTERGSRYADERGSRYATERGSRYADEHDSRYADERSSRYADTRSGRYADEHDSRYVDEHDTRNAAERGSRYASDRQSRYADERSSRSSDERSSRYADTRSSRYAAERNSRYADERSGRSADERGSRYADERSSRYADDRGSRSADDRGSRYADDSGSRSADERGSRYAAERSSRYADERGGRYAAERSSRYADERGSRYADERSNRYADEHDSRYADTRNSRSTDERSSRSADERNSRYADERGSRYADERGSHYADERDERLVTGYDDATLVEDNVAVHADYAQHDDDVQHDNMEHDDVEELVAGENMMSSHIDGGSREVSEGESDEASSPLPIPANYLQRSASSMVRRTIGEAVDRSFRDTYDRTNANANAGRRSRYGSRRYGRDERRDGSRTRRGGRSSRYAEERSVAPASSPAHEDAPVEERREVNEEAYVAVEAQAPAVVPAETSGESTHQSSARGGARSGRTHRGGRSSRSRRGEAALERSASEAPVGDASAVSEDRAAEVATPRESAARRESDSREGAPREGAPREGAPRESAARESAPRESDAREGAPLESAAAGETAAEPARRSRRPSRGRRTRRTVAPVEGAAPESVAE